MFQEFKDEAEALAYAIMAQKHRRNMSNADLRKAVTEFYKPMSNVARAKKGGEVKNNCLGSMEPKQNEEAAQSNVNTSAALGKQGRNGYSKKYFAGQVQERQANAIQARDEKGRAIPLPQNSAELANDDADKIPVMQNSAPREDEDTGKTRDIIAKAAGKTSNPRRYTAKLK